MLYTIQWMSNLQLLKQVQQWQSGNPKPGELKHFLTVWLGYIDELKKELFEEAGSGKSGDKDAFEQNSTVTNHVFSSHGRGKELFENLVNYKSDMLAVDPKLYNTFKDRITVFGKWFDQRRGPKEFTETFFRNTPGIASIAMLSRFENNVKVTENHFMTYCNSTMCIINIVYDSFAPFASISSTYVKTGERIEVTTGIGTFTTVANAKISINNVPIPINTNGIAIYNFKTPLKVGNYSVPIKFEYTETDGRKMTASKKLTYTVIGQ